MEGERIRDRLHHSFKPRVVIEQSGETAGVSPAGASTATSFRMGARFDQAAASTSHDSFGDHTMARRGDREGLVCVDGGADAAGERPVGGGSA